MHLKPHALGLASAILTAVGYGLDALLHVFAPTKTLQLYSYISFNVDLSIFKFAPTWPSFLVGLVAWTVMMYVCGWLFGWVYNKLA